MKRKSVTSQVEDGLNGIKALLQGIFDLKQEAIRLGLHPGQGGPRPRQVQAAGNPYSGDPYAVLGIERDAPDRMVKEIYLLKAVWYHPDSNRMKGGNEDHFKKVLAAWEAIKKERGIQ